MQDAWLSVVSVDLAVSRTVTPVLNPSSVSWSLVFGKLEHG